ncbi:4275_t:CDS:1 [Ambispora leptoticha]|uniref:4275_t:CDS:1 n=1 Tax=Ambispora leptoticha TaxID=144679 RepID=A0A9N9AQ38_9GLOM|nr:4275_t:CDS:1 [Ambispora leptoticha]
MNHPTSSYPIDDDLVNKAVNLALAKSKQPTKTVNGYLLYRMNYFKNNPGKSMKSLSPIIDTAWKNESPQIRQLYLDTAKKVYQKYKSINQSRQQSPLPQILPLSRVVSSQLSLSQALSLQQSQVLSLQSSHSQSEKRIFPFSEQQLQQMSLPLQSPYSQSKEGYFFYPEQQLQQSSSQTSPPLQSSHSQPEAGSFPFAEQQLQQSPSQTLPPLQYSHPQLEAEDFSFPEQLQQSTPLMSPPLQSSYSQPEAGSFPFAEQQLQQSPSQTLPPLQSSHPQLEAEDFSFPEQLQQSTPLTSPPLQSSYSQPETNIPSIINQEACEYIINAYKNNTNCDSIILEFHRQIQEASRFLESYRGLPSQNI